MARLPGGGNIPKPNLPKTPATPGAGKAARGLSRQEKAARLKAEMERAKQGGASESAGAEWHMVQQGETLEDIAAQYDLPPDEVWNHKLNKQLRERRGSPDALAPGDALYIPKRKKGRKIEAVGQGDYQVSEGDCISSIAKQTGHFWEVIWNDPANAELKDARKDPNILLPRDKVTIPPVTQKWEPGETEMRHRFVRKGEPSFLPLTVMDDDKPLANKPYKLIVDNKTYEGTTDADGKIDVPIPGNAKKARLIVGNEDEEQCFEWDLDLGHVDPVECDDGVKKRLNNLGFDSAAEGGSGKDRTEQALRQFQKTRDDLEETGQADENTQRALREYHGS